MMYFKMCILLLMLSHDICVVEMFVVKNNANINHKNIMFIETQTNVLKSTRYYKNYFNHQLKHSDHTLLSQENIDSILCFDSVNGYSINDVIRHYPELAQKKHDIIKSVNLIKGNINELHRDTNFSSNPIPTIPSNLCGECPPQDTLLEPCECLNNGGFAAGTINLSCRQNLTSLEHLKKIIYDANFVDYNVYMFEVLDNDKITGALSNDVWGDLKIEKLYMENNRLSFIDNKAFISFKDSINLISFRGNEISQFYFQSIEDIPMLVNLILQNNELRFMPSDSWHHNNLAHLDLSENLIDVIGPYAFRGLPKLTSLNLSKNKLTTLRDYSLSLNIISQTSTLKIDLSYNNISFISALAFANTTKMQLDLTGNALTTLSEAVFWPIISDSDYYVHFVVNENPIACDCGLKWVVSCVNKAILFSNFQCANMDKKFYMLEVSDLGECFNELHNPYDTS